MTNLNLISSAELVSRLRAISIREYPGSDDNIYILAAHRIEVLERRLTEALGKLPCDFADAEILGAEATADYCYAHQAFCLDNDSLE